jgi:hypothetical protein
MGPATKQDVQTIVDTSKNRVLERVALRQDVQWLMDQTRTLLNLIQQNQQMLKQAEYQRLQNTRRIIALETRVAQLEQEVRGYRQTLNRVADTRPQQVMVPVQQASPAPQNDGAGPEQYPGQYVYRPA